MRLEEEARDDAEVAAAAAKRPEEIRMLRGIRGDEPAVGEDDVGLEQIVDSQPVLARQVAGAATQREPGDAGASNDAERHREAEGVRRMVDRPGVQPGPTRTAGGRIDPHALHWREVDDEPVVAAAESGTVVAAAADGEQQTLLAGELHGGDDVGRVRARAMKRGRLSIMPL